MESEKELLTGERRGLLVDQLEKRHIDLDASSSISQSG
jgi:hypothetical protein